MVDLLPQHHLQERLLLLLLPQLYLLRLMAPISFAVGSMTVSVKQDVMENYQRKQSEVRQIVQIGSMLIEVKPA
ncbi:hypothetical protein E2562_027329 [Oryza meyeriana var. granulata]|uniref:Uncharacterized protein n=1 Tax=Oryza meyeriana var. granulata TaxID=110450 RepID=A0A6G1E266_9ORYZ|nr:hypothetical protein E2562_027329 [Oryza meyeriana var. granulata]